MKGCFGKENLHWHDRDCLQTCGAAAERPDREMSLAARGSCVPQLGDKRSAAAYLLVKE